jgi:hypothetical protein
VNDADLNPWTIFSKDSNIEASHCDCMAGLGSVCTHVAALLFYCEYVSRKKNDCTVTDVPAYWVDPTASKKVNIFPKKVVDICYQNAKSMYKKDGKVEKKNARVNKAHFPKNPIANQKELVKFLENVKNCTPTCVLLKVVPPFCHTFANDEKIKFPFTLTNLYSEENVYKSLDELIIIGNSLKFNLTDDDVAYIEESTRRQSKNKNWHLYRVGRVTASVAYRVCHVKAPDSSISLIKSICYPSSTQLRKKAILWGCEHEKDALAAYLRATMRNHKNLQVKLNYYSIFFSSMSLFIVFGLYYRCSVAAYSFTKFIK